MSTFTKSAPGRGEKTDGERRRSVRTPHVAEAWLSSPTTTDADDRLDAMTLNLSRHGAAFELACPLPEGTFWNLEVGMGEGRLKSEVRVCTSRKTEVGLYEIGVEFC